ncbi:MAG TPA: hypothetical protein VFF65_02395 [Phycisphaerales bacterium]|nr:hypothetical protein [Phycisphaerales bacterium]
MSVAVGYLWACCAVAVGVSVMLGLAVFLGGAGRKGGANYSPWPLMAAITAVGLALQVGYVAAPLAVGAEGNWWRWALVSMAPLALVSLCGVVTNVGLFLRRVARNGWEQAPRGGVLTSTALLGGVYVCAPLVVWLSRGI